jgi:ABC-type dipeptide/oligopeptide/nickel transport system permease subunit
LAGLTFLVIAAVTGLGAPVVAPEGPAETDTTRLRLPPGRSAPLGTDALGRDVLARIVWGSRWTLRLGLLSLLLSVGIGLPVGLAAGMLGGWPEAMLMRVIDALLAFPGLLLAMAMIAVLGPGVVAAAIAVGLAGAPSYARIARAAALDIVSQPYVDAARSIGSSAPRIILRHILPNAAGPLTAFATTQLGWLLLNGAALNFLGLGAQPGSPEWGAMVAEGRSLLREAPWISVFPGIALTLTVLSAHLVADGLQEAGRRR